MSRQLQRGHTLLEIVLGTAVLLLIFAAASHVLTSADNQVKSSRVRLRAAEDHRRNLDAVANALRDADLTTLDGFDATWTSTSPIFSRVTGVDSLARTLGETMQLEWRPSARDVDGIVAPGAVYLLGSSGATLVADNVPQGGFSVRQDGSTLVISLSTYCSTSDRRTTIVTGETAVTLRN